jgi:hypothetical protein
MRPIFIIILFLLAGISVKAQDWEPGYIYDTTGVKQTGFIRFAEKSPIKDEAAIIFKQTKSSPESYYTASGLKSFTMGRDSFVVASQPANTAWNNYYDFVQVLFDDSQLKLFAFYDNPSQVANNSGSGSHFSLGLGLGAGFAGPHFGGGIGGGFAIPLGGSKNHYTNALFYYGANTSHMKPLTNQNFVDVMSEIMGDEPVITDKLHAGKYDLNHMDKLLRDYYKEQTKHPVTAAQ